MPISPGQHAHKTWMVIGPATGGLLGEVLQAPNTNTMARAVVRARVKALVDVGVSPWQRKANTHSLAFVSGGLQRETRGKLKSTEQSVVKW